ncbi:MAG: tetratricopeptide repeat protein [Pseudomonadota bacterium]
MTKDLKSTVLSMCDKAYTLYQNRDYNAALRLFYQAWIKLPKPQSENALSATILSGIGDTYYRMGKYQPAIEALRSAMACPDTEEKALISLRLGQALMDANNEIQAKIYLHKAYQLDSGSTLDEEDPKYREAISEFII